jgi:hypothetical protein
MIYFLQATDGGPIKIGCSMNPNLRSRSLAGLFPYSVEILAQIEGGFAQESFLHHCFRPIAVSQEWFRSIPPMWLTVMEAQNTGTLALFRAAGDRTDESPKQFALREFGSAEAALAVCGYSPKTGVDAAFSRFSQGARARLMFAVARRDGLLPSLITDLHKHPANTMAGAA